MTFMISPSTGDAYTIAADGHTFQLLGNGEREVRFQAPQSSMMVLDPVGAEEFMGEFEATAARQNWDYKLIFVGQPITPGLVIECAVQVELKGRNSGREMIGNLNQYALEWLEFGSITIPLDQ